MLVIFRHKIIRVIRAADERTASHVGEAHGLGGLLVLGKFIRMDELHHGQMFLGGLQILTQRQQVATGRAQIAQASSSSSSVSPKPSMMPDLVNVSGDRSFTLRKTESDRS